MKLGGPAARLDDLSGAICPSRVAVDALRIILLQAHRLFCVVSLRWGRLLREFLSGFASKYARVCCAKQGTREEDQAEKGKKMEISNDKDQPNSIVTYLKALENHSPSIKDHEFGFLAHQGPTHAAC